MRRRAALIALVAAALVVAATAVALAGRGDSPQPEPRAAVPKGPVPRVCWFSDYANAKLSNKCKWREDERRWYMKVEGEMVPADTQKLPVANLCHYFHGTTCPER